MSTKVIEVSISIQITMCDFQINLTTNFDKTCRICLNVLENNYVSVFSNYGENSTLLANKIMACASVQVNLHYLIQLQRIHKMITF